MSLKKFVLYYPLLSAHKQTATNWNRNPPLHPTQIVTKCDSYCLIWAHFGNLRLSLYEISEKTDNLEAFVKIALFVRDSRGVWDLIFLRVSK